MKALILTSPITVEKVVPLSRLLAERGFAVVVSAQDPTAEQVRQWQTDLLISHHNPYIVRDSVIDALDGRCFNIHTAILPLNRGAYPILWAALERTRYGVSIHRLSSGLDKGPLAAQIELAVDEDRTLQEIYDQHARAAEQLFGEFLADRRYEIPRGADRVTSLVAGPGSYHNIARSRAAIQTLRQGWNTPARVARDDYQALRRRRP